MATNPSDPVARVYAAALYEVAKEKGIVGDVYAGMSAIVGAYEDKSFRDFFTSPRVPREVKHKALREALADRISPELMNFLFVLVAKGREPLLDNIFNAFAVYRDEAENRAHAWVEAGSDMSTQEQEDLRKALSSASGGKEVVVHYEYKPEMLGGAKVRLGDLLIDTTLRSRLGNLARALAEAN